jgi:ChrB-like protein
VWREIKKLGAVYLRDGVCVLPEQPDTLQSLRALASRIEAMDGQAYVVQGAQLDAQRADSLKEDFQTARAEEYAEISREAELLLVHVARETEHRDFTYTELEELEQDLSKLKRWRDQVRERDYFAEPSSAPVQVLLDRCDHALASFLEQASQQSR